VLRIKVLVPFIIVRPSQRRPEQPISVNVARRRSRNDREDEPAIGRRFEHNALRDKSNFGTVFYVGKMYNKREMHASASQLMGMPHPHCHPLPPFEPGLSKSSADAHHRTKNGVTEVRVCLSFARGEALLVIVTEEFVEEVDRLVGNVSLVLCRDKARPWLAGVPRLC
jgi:hypothetical protein